MLSVILTLLIGVIAGYGAGKIMNDTSNNLIIDCIVGIVGGFIGKLLFGLIGFASTKLLDNVIVSLVGACLVLYIKKLICK